MVTRSAAATILLLLAKCFASAEVIFEATPPPARRKVLRQRLLSPSYRILPFTASWKIEINPYVDRQPTMREYGGVARATAKWYESNTKQIYGDSLAVHSSFCWVTAAKWKTILDARYAHRITLDCQVTVVADGDNADGAPSIGEFLLDTSANSRVEDFISNYLHKSGGSQSVFQYSSDATYASYERGSYQEVVSEINEEATILDGSFSNFYAMTFEIEWNFLLPKAERATVDDYTLVVRSTQAWLTRSIESYYVYPDKFRLHQVSAKLVGTPIWKIDRHTLTAIVMVVWEANFLKDVPSPAEFLKDMSSGFDLEGFISSYLEPSEGIFKQVQQVSYGTSYVNPNSGLSLESDDFPGIPVEGEQVITVSFIMTLAYSLKGSGIEATWFGSGMVPIEEEWQGLLNATQNFLEVALEEEYNEPNTTSAVSLEGLTARWMQTKYWPWESSWPYRGLLELTLVYSEDSTILPAAHDYKFLVTSLFANDMDGYLSHFVENSKPDYNMFRAINQASLGF